MMFDLSTVLDVINGRRYVGPAFEQRCPFMNRIGRNIDRDHGINTDAFAQRNKITLVPTVGINPLFHFGDRDNSTVFESTSKLDTECIGNRIG